MNRAKATVERLRDSPRIELKELREIWEARTPEEWARDRDVHYLLGAHILRAGEPLLAYDVLSEGCRHHPSDFRLQRKLALALLESGAVERADHIARELGDRGDLHGDTLGIRGRIHKTLAMQAHTAEDRASHLRLARQQYGRGYRLALRRGRPQEALFTGINAATMALLLGRRDEARRIAREVKTVCLRLGKSQRLGVEDRYWVLATLGEAALLLGDLAAAEAHYAEAGCLDPAACRNLSSTRRQARLLLPEIGESPHRLDHCFPVPGITVFAGHMIDRPGRQTPRFPRGLEEAVRAEIARRLAGLDARIGYSSAACGSDILFLEEMLKRRRSSRDVEIHVLLPMPRDVFRETSVDGVDPRGYWGQRFDRVLKQATSWQVASHETTLGNPVCFEYSNRLLAGRALLRAEALEAELTPVVVWNRSRGDGPGGTASIVRNWTSLGRRPVVIDIGQLYRDYAARLKPAGGRTAGSGPALEGRPTREGRAAPAGAAAAVTPLAPRPGAAGPADPAAPPEFAQRIVAVLFADVKQYTRIPNHLIPHFVAHFLGAISQEIARSGVRVLAKGTWGDAVFLVFPSAAVAGRFALDLRSRVHGTSWASVGLPEDLNLRIALHVGPVHRCPDPVTGRPWYFGTHINLGARIEPITPPGEVYASEAFAALAASEGVAEFRCDYVGRMPLAKDFGVYPTYHLRAARASGPVGLGDRQRAGARAEP